MEYGRENHCKDYSETDGKLSKRRVLETRRVASCPADLADAISQLDPEANGNEKTCHHYRGPHDRSIRFEMPDSIGTMVR